VSHPLPGASLRSFPPAVAAHARILILGSMPGVASLDAQQYYAHPRNAFWPLMADLLAIDRELPYRQRLQQLTAAGVALWDVIAACERPGSLDAAIVPDSVQANDFSAFFTVHRDIRHIFFNGGAAASAFRRHVQRDFPGTLPPCTQLPSTSPAHAARNYAQKREAWRVIVDVLKSAAPASV